MGRPYPGVNRYLIIEFIIETLVLVVCCALVVQWVAFVSVVFSVATMLFITLVPVVIGAAAVLPISLVPVVVGSAAVLLISLVSVWGIVSNITMYRYCYEIFRLISSNPNFDANLECDFAKL